MQSFVLGYKIQSPPLMEKEDKLDCNFKKHYNGNDERLTISILDLEYYLV